MRHSGALVPLRHRGFRLLAGGQLASNVGDAFYAVALPWYVLATHGGALLLGTVLAAYGIPRTACLALGGHAADRWKPWTVMMGADAVRAVAVGALAVVAWAGPAHASLLVPVAVVLGAGEGLFLPGSFTIVPTLLPDDELQAGNALTSGGTQLATLAEPALGGAVVAIVGPASAFGVDAVTFWVSALTLLQVRAHQRRTAAAPAPVPGVTPGGAAEDIPAAADSGTAGGVDVETGRPPTVWRLLVSERVLQVILLVTLAANLGMGGMGEVALPALAHGPFHAGASGYGGLVAHSAAGRSPAPCSPRRCDGRDARHCSRRTRSWRSPSSSHSCGTWEAHWRPSAPLVALGALNGFGNVVAITAFQRWAPRALLGRLMGVLMLASMGVFPVSVLFGAVVHAFGPAIFFPIAAGIGALAMLVGLTQRSWRAFGMTGAEEPVAASTRGAKEVPA